MFKQVMQFAAPAIFWLGGANVATALGINPVHDDADARSLSIASSFTREIADEASKKRLIVCCDGTWKNASGTVLPPTNVTRLSRSIDRHGHDVWKVNGPDDCVLPVPQIAYYASGVGTDSVLPVPIDYLYSGVTGQGLEKTILTAYCFLCNNYNFAGRGDEIILVGFSRGAFAVRCLANFIDEVGLIRRKYLSLLPLIFESWIQGKGKVSPEFKDALEREVGIDVRIRALAEWDTVSSLWDSRLSFVGGTVPDAVDNAFLAIAIDERRWSFRPMLWTNTAKAVGSSTKRVEQCLFTGHHGDIGGGNIDTGLSTIALLWMMSQIGGISNIGFDQAALLESIVPILPTGSSQGLGMRYEGLLKSEGRMNHPPWWWVIPHKLTFGMFTGDRNRCLEDAVRGGSELCKEIRVHFTVPLLAEGAAKGQTGADEASSQEIELWKGMRFLTSTLNDRERSHWETWRKQASEWHTDTQQGKSSRMKRWGLVLEKLKMRPMDGSGNDPVVHRVFSEMKRKSPALYETFDLVEEDQSVTVEEPATKKIDPPR